VPIADKTVYTKKDNGLGVLPYNRVSVLIFVFILIYNRFNRYTCCPDVLYALREAGIAIGVNLTRTYLS
jgi:hypothetical protein